MSVSSEDERRRAGSTVRRFFSSEASLQRPGLTGIRALAALLVVVFHLNGHVRSERLVLSLAGHGIDVTPLVTIGWVGVDVFFVLSGFLITIHLAERLAHGPMAAIYPGYLRDRVLRVVPAYWAQIALLLAAAWIAAGSPPDWVRFIPEHLAFLQNLTADVQATINGVYWSLPVEFAFYLLAPPLIVALWPVHLDARRVALRALLVAAAGYAVSIAWRMFAVARFGGEGIPTLFWAASMHLPGAAELFTAGMAAAMLFVARGEPDAARTPAAAGASNALVAAGLAGLVGAMYLLDAYVGRYWSDSALFYGWHSITSVPIAALVVGVAMRGPLARALFENRVVAWLGMVSYSIYLWHPVVAARLAPAVHANEGGVAAFAAVALPAILLVSAASYYLVERPFLRLKRRPGQAPRKLQ